MRRWRIEGAWHDEALLGNAFVEKSLGRSCAVQHTFRTCNSFIGGTQISSTEGGRKDSLARNCSQSWWPMATLYHTLHLLRPSTRPSKSPRSYDSFTIKPRVGHRSIIYTHGVLAPDCAPKHIDLPWCRGTVARVVMVRRLEASVIRSQRQFTVWTGHRSA